MLCFSSCTCEDVYLGEIKLNGQLDQFVPAVSGENTKVHWNGKVGSLGYSVTHDTHFETVPIGGTGKVKIHGKGAVSSCVEYYRAEKRIIGAYSGANALPFTISITLTKNFNPERYLKDYKNGDLDDVVHYSIAYITEFPKTVTRGMLHYDAYKAQRTFAFSLHPERLINKPVDIKQELLHNVTLNGKRHDKLYHVYLTSTRLSEEEEYLNAQYPLSFIKGIYVKEGVGLIHAYTQNGDTIEFSPL
ncbi:hypothetical protein [Telluribacter sp. SYSU D00476]|uniref:hypothetical protein n=1 Tax=Telluribacter sp. SYSU D00476 TaxID=2811430 RepID=UPI001FF692BE|nr:hypothetical protein [Telluribacter sp. SYSU D00476]